MDRFHNSTLLDKIRIVQIQSILKRIAEIQDLTARYIWEYVDSDRNPADDLTRGKTLKYLSVINRWSQGPLFLLEPESARPITPAIQPPEDRAEHRKGIFCGISTEVMVPNLPDPVTYSSWK